VDFENPPPKAQEFIQRVQEVWNATWKDAYSQGPRWSKQFSGCFHCSGHKCCTGHGGRERWRERWREGDVSKDLGRRGRGQAPAQAAEVQLVLRDLLHSFRACRISRDLVTWAGKNCGEGKEM